MKSPVYSGIVQDGKLPPAVSQQIATVMRGMEGKRLAVTLSEMKRRRSNNQNSYYWGCVIPHVLNMFREAGNDTDADEVHEYLKQHIGKLTGTMIDPYGEIKMVVKSSSRLSTVEFEEFMERIRAWAAGFGVQIPLPNEF